MVIVRQKIIFKLSFHPTFCLKVDKKLNSLYDGIRLLTDIFFSSPTCYDIRFEAQKYICH